MADPSAIWKPVDESAWKPVNEPVDMSPKNTGTDKSDEGFLAHAGKTIKALPNAFLSGNAVTAPLDSVKNSMSDFISNPTFHNSVRAIPGVAMAEDAITQPYRTAQSGDVAGAYGDAADIIGQGIAGRIMGGRGATSDPQLATVKTGTGGTSLPEISPMAEAGAHAAGLAGVPAAGLLPRIYKGIRSAVGPFGGDSRVYGPPMNTATSARPSWMEKPPSGSMGSGMQSGFGIHVVPPAPINPVSLPEGVIPPRWQAPNDPAPLHGFGPTAPSDAGSARFVPGQYDLRPSVRAYTPDPEDMWQGTAPTPIVTDDPRVIERPLTPPPQTVTPGGSPNPAVTQQYQPSRTRARFDVNGNRIGG